MSNINTKAQADLLSGNKLPEGATPFAQAYAGHQFGHFTLLGDGRAVMWGEHITPDQERVDIQFKGSGKTPYSRNGDGRAALGPMLREYVISEAMYHLSIPTTRSLAVTKTGEQVIRDTTQPGAILTRTAQSHIRVGTFEFAAMHGNKEFLSALTHYTIKRHYSDLSDNNNEAIALLNIVMEKQIDLMVHYMRVGFIHGVMNTDNMLISGESIDYGPCAFLDNYHPNTTFSAIDQYGRYAFNNQPSIAQWNIARLAEALLPLLDDNNVESVAKTILQKFTARYERQWIAMMRAKIGLFDEYSGDLTLITELLSWMSKNAADFTNTFNSLSKMEKPKEDYQDKKTIDEWYIRWQKRLKKNNRPLEDSMHLMRKNNPVVIPRNHQVELALDAANNGDLSKFHALVSVIQNPYTENDRSADYMLPPTLEQRVYQTFCGT